MQHQIYPDRFNDDGEFVPAVIVEVPNIIYLQVVDEGDCGDWPAPSEPDERTFCYERINESDVPYVPLARAERAEAEAEALRAQLDTVRDAAHVPDDWPHGLPSWIAQRLYAAYIGAAFAPEVMEQIAAGRLAFPEAPIYAEAAALRAELDAAVRSAAETELRLNATIDALRAERDAARGIETAEQPPEVGQRVQIIITADFVHGGFEPVADNRLFLPRHMAPFWRPLWAGTERGYEIHTITGSTSAGRRRARRGGGVTA